MKTTTHWILVKAEMEENIGKNGIVLPGDSERRTYFGEVLAVGPKVREVSKGDWVRFQQGAGHPLKDDVYVKDNVYAMKEGAIYWVDPNKPKNP